jgi:hypothetical protein
MLQCCHIDEYFKSKVLLAGTVMNSVSLPVTTQSLREFTDETFYLYLRATGVKEKFLKVQAAFYP